MTSLTPHSVSLLDTSLFAHILNVITEPLYVKDDLFRWVYVNDAFCEFVGYDKEMLSGKTEFDLFPAPQAEDSRLLENKVFETGEELLNVEAMTDATGRIWTVSSHKSLLVAPDGKKYLVGIIRDITESHRRESYQEHINQMLQRLVLGAGQEEIFQVALQIAEKEIPGSIASILVLNKKSQRLYQAVPSSLPEEFIRKIDGTAVRLGMGACGEAAYLRRRVIIEEIATHPNWSLVRDVTSKHNLVTCWSQPVLNHAGGVEGTFALYFNTQRSPKALDLEILETLAQLVAITFEQQSTQRESIQLRQLMSDMINAMPSVLIAVDAKGRILQWNAEAERVTGVLASEAKARELGSVLTLTAEQLGEIYHAIDERQSLSWTKLAHRWGNEERWLDLTLYPISGSRQAGSVIRLDDVTDQVRIEQMMIQTEKIHSLGGLAAGMAHEINNPLAAILQNVQVMQNRLQKGLKKNTDVAESCGGSIEIIEAYMQKREIRSLMEMIVEAGRRASSIVTNMLEFCRRGDVRIRPQDLMELMDKTIALLDNDYNQSQRYDFRCVTISRDYAPDLPQVPCEGTNLQQVFFNLLKNAAQAMAMAEIADPQIRVSMKVAGDWFRVEVEDNGPGLELEVQRRIFEPFYTTKPVGTGTGLGLSVAYFIITEAHQGRMVVESQLGRGARFIIELPLNYEQDVNQASSG